MPFIIRRTDGWYARTPYQRNGKTPTLSGPVKWEQRQENATRFTVQIDAEQIAGQLQNPPTGVDIEVIEI